MVTCAQVVNAACPHPFAGPVHLPAGPYQVFSTCGVAFTAPGQVVTGWLKLVTGRLHLFTGRPLVPAVPQRLFTGALRMTAAWVRPFTMRSRPFTACPQLFTARLRMTAGRAQVFTGPRASAGVAAVSATLPHGRTGYRPALARSGFQKATPRLGGGVYPRLGGALTERRAGTDHTRGHNKCFGYSSKGPRKLTSPIFTVSLGFTNVTPAALLDKGRNHVVMLTGNAEFPTPTPATAVLTVACDKLEAASNAYNFNRGKLEKEARDVAFTELKALIRELGGYVQSNCKGEKELILSTGFDVRRPNEPVGDLPAPGNLIASPTLYPGRIDLRWEGVKGRSAYEVYINDGDPSSESGWRLLLVTPKTRFIATSLTSNKTYAFRVVAIGPAGASPVSDVAIAKAA